MSCGHVCVRVLFWAIIGLVSSGLLVFLFRADKEFEVCNTKNILISTLFFVLLGALLLPTQVYEQSWVVQACYAGMAVYFTACGVMDLQWKMVYDLLHYIGLVSGLGLLWVRQPEAQVVWELIIFIMLQMLLFGKMFGSADVAMFMICAMFFAAEGGGIERYLEHMVVTLGVLGFVQGVRGNIASDGNLKAPVALIPYIVPGFLLII